MSGITPFIANTENRNELSLNIDMLETADILEVINQNDQTIADKVREQIPSITRAVDAAYATFQNGGRIIYIGAGTSGRLGVLDASECPPTYGVSPDAFVGIIAGGSRALQESAENAEDDPAQAVTDLQAHRFCAGDMLIGIAASGRTPYVLGALRYAKELGATAALLACSSRVPEDVPADIKILVDTGAEVVTGSTRMKAGTAQKMVLNMISTATLIKSGRVYGNLMVDVRPTNEKLVDRATRIIAEITGLDQCSAADYLERSGQNVKTAVVMAERNVEKEAAERLIAKAGGHLRRALEY